MDLRPATILFKELCHIMNIKKTRTTAYHPEGNGMVERTNRTLKGLLKAFINHETFEQWDVALPRCLLAYRATIQTSIGQTPSFMTTGREMRIPSDTLLPTPPPEALYSSVFVRRLQAGLVRGHELARQHLRASQRYQKDYYDRTAQDRLFNPGDRVWLYEPAPPSGIPAKFHRAWKGPYTIEQALTDVTYRLVHPGKPGWSTVVHVNRLKSANMISDSALLRGGPV
ncbi:transposon Ty3-I gap-Pol polyprotein [Clonorchis sinensis]|uniref:Transposon Ty3-I gap-Pol polyprotein n=1 Tax=Clonorchis sinensis TaxID=79923 RepID=G7YC78_CLOSI|nr:transposon Ty3-I gap-Pol polyprotein [Clonorchis sinensis]